MLLHLSPVSIHFPTEISFMNSLVYFVYLLVPRFTYFLGFFSKLSNFSFYFLDFLTHIFRSQKKITIKIKKNKTTNLTRDRWWSPLLLTFSGAILKPLFFISALFLSVLSFQTPSPLYCGPNPLQLGHISLLALHQVLKGSPDFLVLLHKFPECLFNSI